ncbi:hypothetical protein COCC4DRAFT_66261 [Bipolaris maydis ATCC 48331]|uniref:Uncharacterized protein n=2 Tax=Cochliobolus heterostrophus TaxID=5016 RepID=M2ULV0_COCH5|nr:uncharacterized protein COCC4DRAFT_66261 [Bipolaris maydis ATCC 48331]EMD94596.1 hypothetical protein COCHEDRAFT_1210636 [Bipolaris maydis C5]KAJ5029033.1 hypothetical protein J3E73DRAFT_366401 [Bipolaris maydis]ENH99681.1 hypothetical protein COCC4DRAFT_66261 [Bipolaris maydis ATCC 48331]KAJ6215223.1 hypothetical protein PSV09DRAFT_1210636 [Bipolaris maydis]KAJ6276347.1 hypothetical protein PSV08DRAFT_346803 [Bipolaris maydis]
MAISIEATIAIVTLLIMCVPGGFWIVYRISWLRPRPQREIDEEIALTYQRQPISNNPSPTPTWPVMVDAPFGRLFDMNGQLPVAMISLEVNFLLSSTTV